MVIFFYGEDAFRSHQKLLEIKQKYLDSDKSGSGLSSFDFSDRAKAGEILDVFSLPNLLAPKRLVLVKRMIGQAGETDQKMMLEYLKQVKDRIISDQDLVIVFWEEQSPKKNNSLFKFLDSHAKKQKFEKLIGQKINQWVIKRLKEIAADAAISKSALDKLVAFCGDDIFFIEAELQKLVSYAGGKMIESADVEQLVRANIDANIFNTIDALANNNKPQAVQLLHNHLKNGEDPFYLFSMFVYQFRNLLKIADLKDKRVHNEYELAKLAKMHPYVVKKSLAQLRNFSFPKLKTIYKQLQNFDRQIKTGKIDIKLALDKFVVEL